ncbi:MAG: 30S ribosomal protein S5 [Candidatus Aenigmatarchaeota archaeon]
MVDKKETKEKVKEQEEKPKQDMGTKEEIVENVIEKKPRGKGSFASRGDRKHQRRAPAEEWIPKTQLGHRVLKGEFASLEDLLMKGETILEPEIVETLVPDLQTEVIYIGGSPGKGGGIRRTATKRTVRVHKSGRRFKLTAVIVVGDGRNIVGVGKASSREHRVAIEKATKQAKLNVLRVVKGCGSWECGCDGSHSIPFKTEVKFGSVTVKLMPAPKGLGIVADKESRKILGLSGISDVWVKTRGQTGTRTNLAYAIFEALKQLNKTKGDL